MPKLGLYTATVTLPRSHELWVSVKVGPSTTVHSVTFFPCTAITGFGPITLILSIALGLTFIVVDSSPGLNVIVVDSSLGLTFIVVDSAFIVVNSSLGLNFIVVDSYWSRVRRVEVMEFPSVSKTL